MNDLFRQLVWKFGRGGSWAFRILEGVAGGEARLLDDSHGVEEVFLCLTGESYDQVGGDCRIGNGRANTVENSKIFLGSIRPTHFFQNSIATRLQRHVQGRHYVRRLGHRFDNVIGEGSRMRAGKTNSLETLNAAACAQELCKGSLVAKLDAVGVDVLAQKSNLDNALGY